MQVKGFVHVLAFGWEFQCMRSDNLLALAFHSKLLHTCVPMDTKVNTFTIGQY